MFLNEESSTNSLPAGAFRLALQLLPKFPLTHFPEALYLLGTFVLCLLFLTHPFFRLNVVAITFDVLRLNHLLLCVSDEVSIIEQQRVASHAHELLLYSFQPVSSSVIRIIHRLVVCSGSCYLSRPLGHFWDTDLAIGLARLSLNLQRHHPVCISFDRLLLRVLVIFREKTSAIVSCVLSSAELVEVAHRLLHLRLIYFGQHA